jgi:hypothetical protein
VTASQTSAWGRADRPASRGAGQAPPAGAASPTGGATPREAREIGIRADDRPLTRADIEAAASRYYAHLPRRVDRLRTPGRGYATWIKGEDGPDIYVVATSDETGLWARLTAKHGGATYWAAWTLPVVWARSGHIPWRRAEAAAGRLAARKAPVEQPVQLDLLTEVG